MTRRVIKTALAALAVAAVSLPVPALARGNPGQGGGGGGRPPNAGTETVGNNLSYPAVFAEGTGITGLAPAATDSTLQPWQQTWTGPRTVPSADNPVVLSAADEYVLNGTTYYLQGQEGSSWQAGWINGKDAAPWSAYVC